MQVGECVCSFSIIYIISSDLGCIKCMVEIIVQVCGCDIIFDFCLCELDMGVLEKCQIDLLMEEEEGWCCQLVNGMQDGCIFGGELMQELSDCVYVVLVFCLELLQGS